MGLPLHQTNMVSFFEVLFKIRAQNEDRLHFKTLLELSGHPVLKKHTRRNSNLLRPGYIKTILFFNLKRTS